MYLAYRALTVTEEQCLQRGVFTEQGVVTEQSGVRVAWEVAARGSTTNSE